MTMTLEVFRIKREKVSSKNDRRDMLTALVGLLLPIGLGGLLLASSSAISLVSEQLGGRRTSATYIDGAHAPVLSDAVAVSAESVAAVAENLATEQRLAEIERQLVVARELEAKEQRYERSFADSIRIETPPGTVVYALGGSQDQVSVDCESTEFGYIATLATSANPDNYYRARYLSGCTSGTVAGGTAVGETISILGWSQRSQETGAPEEPNTEAAEWALSGYTGQYAAPKPKDTDLAETLQIVRNRFDKFAADANSSAE